jgi:hypothetical protein
LGNMPVAVMAPMPFMNERRELRVWIMMGAGLLVVGEKSEGWELSMIPGSREA